MAATVGQAMSVAPGTQLALLGGLVRVASLLLDVLAGNTGQVGGVHKCSCLNHISNTGVGVVVGWGDHLDS